MKASALHKSAQAGASPHFSQYGLVARDPINRHAVVGTGAIKEFGRNLVFGNIFLFLLIAARHPPKLKKKFLS
ncbi:MAG: hypothetical protein RDA78_18660 [Roseibium sp.]|uniref:hypothetical protein n=1 Tax=Roseibium sp. TaxID=1936156 RepID=UPI003D9C26D2